MEKVSRNKSTTVNKQEIPKKKNLLKCTHCHRYGHAKSSCRYLKRKIQVNEKLLQKELQETLLETFCAKLKESIQVLLNEVLQDLPNEIATIKNKIEKICEKMKQQNPHPDPQTSFPRESSSTDEKTRKKKKEMNQDIPIPSASTKEKRNQHLKAAECFNIDKKDCNEEMEKEMQQITPNLMPPPRSPEQPSRHENRQDQQKKTRSSKNRKIQEQ